MTNTLKEPTLSGVDVNTRKKPSPAGTFHIKLELVIKMGEYGLSANSQRDVSSTCQPLDSTVRGSVTENSVTSLRVATVPSRTGSFAGSLVANS